MLFGIPTIEVYILVPRIIMLYIIDLTISVRIMWYVIIVWNNTI